jgi:hypothetical protein
VASLIAPVLAIALAVAVNVVRGAHGGIAYFLGLGRPITWLATLFLLAGALALIGIAVNHRWDGVFIDGRNKISLSRTQLICWSTLLVSALFTAGLANSALMDQTPLAITIPASIWALLGLGSFTAVASPLILERKTLAPTPPSIAAASNALKTVQALSAVPIARGSVMQKMAPADARWIDLVLGDESDAAFVDISKVQKLAFTALLLVIYGAGLFSNFAMSGSVKHFPDVDPGFVALLAVSHAAYLGYKMTPKGA